MRVNLLNELFTTGGDDPVVTAITSDTVVTFANSGITGVKLCKVTFTSGSLKNKEVLCVSGDNGVFTSCAKQDDHEEFIPALVKNFTFTNRVDNFSGVVVGDKCIFES